MTNGSRPTVAGLCPPGYSFFHPPRGDFAGTGGTAPAGGKEERMNWLYWALLSALFAGLTAVLAKVGVREVDSNLATAIRTLVILLFAWSIALATNTQSLAAVPGRTWLFLVLSG